jgi:carboxymethylenebutenolidase
MMQRTKLTSRHDAIAFEALHAKPAGAPIGGVVVIQEIFGLTDHVAEMCERFASEGYEVLAPSLFDRVEPGFLAGLDAEGIAKGRDAVIASPWAQVMGDVQAAIDALPKPAFITGFCYGGAVSWVAAARCEGLKAASCFYGRLIVDKLDEAPKIPVMLHYGARDTSIPMDQVERVRAASPHSPLYIYDAGHGFCRKASHDYDETASTLALSRTVDWFARWR